MVLTREQMLGVMSNVTVAPITRTIKGLSTEVSVGVRNGLDDACVVSCDNIQTIPAETLGRRVGMLLDNQEAALAEAICSAFALQV